MTTAFVTNIMNTYQPLTKEQEQIATPEELVLHNVQFGLTYAHRYAHHMLSPEDLISEMFYAMVEAANTFDTSKGTKFITHASTYIRYRFIDEIHKNKDTVNVNGGQRKKENRVRKFIDEYVNKHNEEPTDDIISKELNISKTTLKNLKLYAIKTISSIHANPNGDDDNGCSLANILPSEIPDPFEHVLSAELYELMHNSAMLNTTEGNLIHDKYIENLTYAELSKKYKIPYNKVKAVITVGLTKMRDVLDG
jgi:RNA polymerase primary sigma factor